MPAATLTSKGQLVVPKSIRDRDVDCTIGRPGAIYGPVGLPGHGKLVRLRPAPRLGITTPANIRQTAASAAKRARAVFAPDGRPTRS